MGFLSFLRGGSSAAEPSRPARQAGGTLTGPDDVASARFTSVRFGEGYDVSEVDDALAGPLIAAWREDRELLDQLERHLGDLRRGTAGSAPIPSRPSARSGPEAVVHARFAVVRFSEGYAMEDVDLFLDQVHAAWSADLERIAALQSEAEELRSPGLEGVEG